ncbi:MAG: hypothetical protein FWF29_13425 [Treponema sp.]|nr:hypothetical protein [Treponema sp.]
MRSRTVFFLFAAALVFAAACPAISRGNNYNGDIDSSMLSLSAETTHPASNIFIQGSVGSDYIKLTVSGIGSYSGLSFTVDYEITDIFGTVVTEGSFEYVAAEGNVQTKQIPIDKSKLGHFTFTASVPDGPSIALPVLGTRPTHFISYAVMADPSQRKQKAGFNQTDVDKYLYFGMAFVGTAIYDRVINMVDCLGIDATVTGQLQWNANFNTGSATNVAKINQWIVNPSSASTLRQTVYYLSELTPYMPAWARTDAGQGGSYGGELNAKGETEFVKYIEGMAQIHIAAAPDRPHHYYQILWEPVDWWGAWTPPGDQGGDAALVRVYELAYTAIHRVYDQKAIDTGDVSWKIKPVVLGPTYSDCANRERTLDWHERQFNSGLANYIDGLSVHPYYDPGTNTGATDNKNDFDFAETVRALMDMTLEYYDSRDTTLYPKYFDKPFFWSTEQGLKESSRVNGPKVQAQLLTRENLIMMGEGFSANHAFCFSDFDQTRYGYFYNHTAMESSGDIYAPAAVSPKPVACAYAALSLLLKGYRGEGRIGGLSGTNFGYRYSDSDGSGNVIYALWNYGKNMSDTVTIPTGTGKVTVYDIAGNGETQDCPGNNLTITLNEYVQYVLAAGIEN